MEPNPAHCTWLDLQAHDRLVDDTFIAADKYEDFMHFLHHDYDSDDTPPENLRPNA